MTICSSGIIGLQAADTDVLTNTIHWEPLALEEEAIRNMVGETQFHSLVQKWKARPAPPPPQP